MNRRWIFLLVLIALGLLAWMLHLRSSPSTLARPLSDFAIKDTSRVDRIFISDQTGRSIDLRRTNDGWTVNDVYKAKQHDVDLLLRTFVRVEVRSPVPKSTEATVLRTMAVASKRVEIYEGGRKPSKTWIIGHGTKDHFGTYAILETAEEGRSDVPFILGMSGFTGILGPRFHTMLDDWRRTEVFAFADLHQIAEVEVEHPQVPRESYRIQNLGRGEVRMTDLQGNPMEFDTILVQGALLPFERLNYEYIERQIDPYRKDSLLNTSPNHIIRVTTRDGGKDEMKIWYMPYKGEEGQWDPQKLHDQVRMHALVQDSLLVVVQRHLFDRLVQPASALKP
jgi:hypothetical protein